MVFVEILEVIGLTGPIAGAIELVAILATVYIFIDMLKNGSARLITGK